MKNDYSLFIMKNRKNGEGPSGELLIRQAALEWGLTQDELAEDEILRSDKGKPFFKSGCLNFSISHSKALWACLMGPFNCGLDVQYIKPCDFYKIAGRFYSADEAEYVKNSGIEGFFDIWVRKEALGKYTGEGFFGCMPQMVSKEGVIKNVITSCEGENLIFRDIYLGGGIKCVACVPYGYENTIYIKNEWKGAIL